MTNKFVDPFHYNYPQLDLHGEVSDIAVVLVDEFIKDNYKLGNKHVIIIHGRGTGKIKKALYDYLENCKYVSSYKQDNFNMGSTIIELKNKD